MEEIYSYLFTQSTNWDLYVGNGTEQLNKFRKHKIIDKACICVSCRRGREGFDIPGLETIFLIIDNSVEPHHLLQVSGRVLRLDYPEKIGDIIIFQSQTQKSTEDCEEIFFKMFNYIIDVFDLRKHLDDIEVEGESILTKLGGFFHIIGNFGLIYDKEWAIKTINKCYLREQVRKKDIEFELTQEENRRFNIKT